MSIRPAPNRSDSSHAEPTAQSSPPQDGASLTAPHEARPVAPTERIELIDVLRGVAIFGILLVNVLYFACPMFTVSMPHGMEYGSWADRVARVAIGAAAEGKFYSLFSFLFGVGMAVQIDRARARGVQFGPLFLRRLTVLLLIGLVHMFLIWFGDILVWYALTGFVLFALRSFKDTTLAIIAAGLFLGSAVCFSSSGPGSGPGAGTTIRPAATQPAATQPVAGESETPTAAATQSAATQAAASGGDNQHWSFAEVKRRDIQWSYDAYQSSDYLAMLQRRLMDAGWSVLGFVFQLFWHVLAFFLIGRIAGRRRWLWPTRQRRGWLWSLFAFGLLIGLPVNVFYAVVVYGLTDPSPHLQWYAQSAYWLTYPALTAAYVCGISLAYRTSLARRLLHPLAVVGRTALSNYILQSLVCTTLFYGYGYGLYGEIGPAGLLGIAVVLFAVQIPLSNLWLRYFRFGPLEWLWRSATYGHWQPLR